LGLTPFSKGGRDALFEYLAAAPFDVIDRVVTLCLLDVAERDTAGLMLLHQFDRYPAMLQLAVRRGLLNRPRRTAQLFMQWFACGGLLRQDETVVGFMTFPDKVVFDKGDRSLDYFHSLLLGQLKVVAEQTRLRGTLVEPANRILRLLRRRTLAVGWSEFIPPSTWNMALAVLKALSSDRVTVAGRSLAAIMYACIDVVDGVDDFVALATLKKARLDITKVWPPIGLRNFGAKRAT
jgi:hypothetical protein